MSAVKTVVELMEVSALTAPKARGQGHIVTRILEGDELEVLAARMTLLGEQTQRQFLIRDAGNVRASEAVLLIGLQDGVKADLDCGACGHATCEEMQVNTFEGEFRGPQCAFRLIDLGIAVGSAVKTASMLNVDNRVMYSVGVGARAADLIDADVLVGIPLSATSKNIYHDRK
jgi:uncharacterized ferredoxin-like protein